MRLRTRMLSLVLAGSMTLSVLPVSAFAAEGDSQPTPQTSVSDASEQEASSGTLAFDKYGYPYDASKGDEYEKDHSTEAVEKSSDGTWYYTQIKGSSEYLLWLTSAFQGDLTGITVNCRVNVTGGSTLTGGTFNKLVEVQNNGVATGCTFNDGVFFYGTATATVRNCTLNHGLTNYCADGRIDNCTFSDTASITARQNTNQTPSQLSVQCEEVPAVVLAYNNSTILLSTGTYTSSICAYGTSTINVGHCTVKGSIQATEGSTIHVSFSDVEKNCFALGKGHLEIEGGTYHGSVSAETAGNLTVEGGVFAEKPVGVSDDILRKLEGDNCTFNGIADQVYVVNQDVEPIVNIVYTPTDKEHKIVSWRVDTSTPVVENMPTFGYTDSKTDLVTSMKEQVHYQASDDLTELSFQCKKFFTTDVKLTPVVDVLASELDFKNASGINKAEVALDYNMPSGIEIDSVYMNVATGDTSSDYPTEDGTYQIGVNLYAPGLTEEQKSDSLYNRVEWNGVYHQLPNADKTSANGANILTSEVWRFHVGTQTAVSPEIDANGKPVIDPEKNLGAHYDSATDTLTLDEGYQFTFGWNTPITCNVVCNGVLDGGMYTGTVSGTGIIRKGLFLNKPSIPAYYLAFSVPASVTLNHLHSPSGVTLYAVNTSATVEDSIPLSFNYTELESGRDFYGWDELVSMMGQTMNAFITESENPLYNPFTGQIYNEMDGAEMRLVPVVEMNTGDLNITADDASTSVAGVAVKSVLYYDLSNPDAEPSETYPTKLGKYEAHVTLECTDPVYLTSKPGPQPFVLNGDLCYHVPEELIVPITLTSSIDNPTVSDGKPATDPDSGLTEKGDGVALAPNYEADFSGTEEITCDVETSGNIVGGTFSGDITVTDTGALFGGIYTGSVANEGEISGGTFEGKVTGNGTITGGTFAGDVDASMDVQGGVFTEETGKKLESKVTYMAPVTVTGGAAINNVIRAKDGDESVTAYVATDYAPQDLTLAYDNDSSHAFYGWQETRDDNDSTIIDDSAVTSVHMLQNTRAPLTYTPVVLMNESDLSTDAEGNVTSVLPDVEVDSVKYYIVSEDGTPDTSTAYDEAPTTPGVTYGKFAALSIKDGSADDEVNSIALFAAGDADRVVKQGGLGYYVPELMLLGKTTTNGSDSGDIDEPETPSSGDSGAGVAVAAVVGTAAVGGAAYLIGTQVYLNNVLPEGTAIPTNRQQLADLLWTAAGKPEPKSSVLFTDISAEASDSQKAARWCVEQGLLSDSGASFKPGDHTFRLQVIQAWNQLQDQLKSAQ